jgi:hypothetical protein
MPYKYAQIRENYEIYASGGVFYAAPGYPAFPVRLAHEVFQRCLALWDANPPGRRCTLYDPCCGGAYHLTTLAYLNWRRIARIAASDLDPAAVSLGLRNLSLLSTEGLDRRINELAGMAQQFSKPSHAAALKHARLLRQRLADRVREHSIETQVFRADATDPHAIQVGLSGTPADIVFADIPYGQHSHWHVDTRALLASQDPVHQLLESLLPVLSPGAVVAIASPKRVRPEHERYQRSGKLTLGKRQIVFLKPARRVPDCASCPRFVTNPQLPGPVTG